MKLTKVEVTVELCESDAESESKLEEDESRFRTVHRQTVAC